jgi:hypothetical protein
MRDLTQDLRNVTQAKLLDTKNERPVPRLRTIVIQAGKMMQERRF